MVRKEELANAILKAVNSCPTTDELVGVTLTEATVVSVVTDVVKGIIRKLFDLVSAAYNKARSLYDKARTKVREFRRDMEYLNTARRRKNPWTSETGNIARDKAFYDNSTVFEMHKWDDVYIDSLPERLQHYDTALLSVDGRTISVTAEALIEEIQRALDKNQFDLEILDRYNADELRSFRSAFQADPSDESLIRRAGGSVKVRIPVSVDLVDRMSNAIDNCPDILYNISVSYKDLMKSYRAAEHAVDQVRLHTPADAAKANRFVNMISSILQDKNMKLRTVQGVHSNIVNMRMDEYIKVLKEYAH